MQELLRQLEAVAQPTVATGAAGLAERNQDFRRLLGREKLVSQLRYLDAPGRSGCAARRSRSTGSTAGSTLAQPRRSSARGRGSGTSAGSTSSSAPSRTCDRGRRARAGRRRRGRRDRPESVGEVIERARIGTRATRTPSTRAACSSPTRTSTSSSGTRASRRFRRCGPRCGSRRAPERRRDDRARPRRDEGAERLPDRSSRSAGASSSRSR